MTEKQRVELILTTDEKTLVKASASALANCDELYQRGGDLVHVVPVMEFDTMGNDISRLAIKTVSSAHLRTLLCGEIDFVSYKLGSEGEPKKSSKHPPNYLASQVQGVGGWPVKVISSVTSTPYFAADGTIRAKAAYDPVSKVLLINPLPVDVPDEPTPEQITAAKELLCAPVQDFKFDTDHSEAAYVAGIVGPLGRHAYDKGTPAVTVVAAKPTSGKSLMIETIGHVAFGRPIQAMRSPKDPDELDKKLLGFAKSGAVAVHIGNIPAGKAFGSEALAEVITGSRVGERALGLNENLDLYAPIAWYLDGNNIQLTDDMETRVLWCRLAEPGKAPFKLGTSDQLISWVTTNRSRLVSAALTLLRGWHIAGRPPLPPGSPPCRFEGWSKVVRACIVWAYGVDPIPMPAQGEEALGDTELHLLELLEGLKLVSKAKGCATGFTSASLIKEVVPDRSEKFESLKAILLYHDISMVGEVNPVKLSRVLGSFRDRTVEGLTLKRLGIFAGKRVYSVIGERPQPVVV